MTLVFPFVESDYEKALQLARWIDRLGKNFPHSVVVLYPKGLDQKADTILRVLANGFGYSEKHCVGDLPRGWPEGPNAMFKAACAYMEHHKTLTHWLWMEPDVYPFTPDWLDRWEKEYTFCKRPFMGWPQRTMRIKNGELYQDGEHMNGVGVYPKSVRKYVEWIQSVSPKEAFDVAIQWEVMRKDRNGQYERFAPTRLMEHRWSTNNHRVVSRGNVWTIECDPLGTSALGGQYKIDPKGELGPVMVHGCKDNTLPEILESMVFPDSEGLTLEERVLRRHREGAIWKELIGEFKLQPAKLKKILESA